MIRWQGNQGRVTTPDAWTLHLHRENDITQAEPVYVGIINDMFVNDPANQDRDGDMKLHPSAISGCERNAIYAARGEPITNPRDVRYTRIMGNGTDYHTKLQAYIMTRWPDAICEQKVDWGLIHGAADVLLPVGVLTDILPVVIPRVENAYELADFKTISPNGKRYIQGLKPRTLKNGTFKPGREAAPKPEHVLQVRIYYTGLRRMGFNLLPQFRIVYIDRDDWSTIEFLIDPWTPEEEDTYLEHMAELEAHLFDGTLPDKIPDDYWLCNLCEWRTTCKGWDDEDE